MTAPSPGEAPSPAVFRIYLVAVVTTVTGNFAQTVALAILTLDLTGSALFVGLAISVRHLPLLLFGPIAGRHLEGANLARVTAVAELADAAVAVAFTAIAVAGQVNVGVILGFVLLSGLFNVVDLPARTALVSDLVPADRVARAVAWTNTAAAAGRVTGPAAATAVIAVGSLNVAFALNALSFAAAGLLFAGLARRIPTREDRPAAQSSGPGVWSLLRSHRYGPTLVATLAVTVLALNCEVVLLFALDQQGSRGLYGVVLAAMGIGGAVGTLGAGRWAAPRQTLSAGFAAGGAAALMAIGLAPAAWAIVAGAAAGGVSIGAFTTTSMVWVQKAPAGEHRRVVSLYSALLTGAGPLGAPLAGALTDLAGPRWAAAGLGTALAVVSGAAWTWGRPRHSPDPVGTVPVLEAV